MPLSRTLLSRLGGALLASLSFTSQGASLVDENFDDATAGTIQSVLMSSPSALPSGTTWSSTTDANGVHLRAGTDTINTYNTGNPLQRFSMMSGTTYFNPNTAANNFLVLGDDSGQLAGSPLTGTFGFAIPFKVSADATTVRILFEYVFKAFVLPLTGTGDTDRFVAGIGGNGFSIANPLSLSHNLVDRSITSKGALEGPLDVTIDVATLGQPDASGNYYLVFALFESSGISPTTNSAVGIDNILIDDDGTSGGGGGEPPPPSTFLLPPASSGNPSFSNTHFLGSQNCAMCHDGLRDALNQDVSIGVDWSSTMMANSSRDPLWRAKLRSELTRHPELASVINDKCTRCHAPMANFDAKVSGAAITALDGGVLSSSDARHDLALDGVSCTLCHRIEDSPALGTLEGMSGHYEIDSSLTGTSRAIYGPFEAPFTMPMQHMAGVTPVYSPHIRESKLCATCHNLKTPYVDAAGNVLSTTPESEFPEQMPYSEWEHSAYVDQQSCQDCHMDRADGARVSNRPPWLGARDGVGVHDFIGANKLMLDILDKNRSQLGVLSTNFAETIAKTEAMLKGAGKVEVVDQSAAGGVMAFTLRVVNYGGHKLPTSYPSRRALLHVRVSDPGGQVVWESGKVNDDGSVDGVDGDASPDAYEPHYDLITAPDQVQVYEAVMGNDQGEVTHTLLRAKSYLKDNRLLPTGFDKASAPPDIQVVGEALSDPSFGGGSDEVRYRIGGLPIGSYSVKAELVYQTASYAFTQDLFTDEAEAEVADFKTMFEASSAKSSVMADVAFAAAVAPNQAPVAVIDAGRVVRQGSAVTLSAGASFDPDGAPNPLTFRWTLEAPAGASQALTSTPGWQFTPTTPGSYRVSVEGYDGANYSLPARAAFTVQPLGAVDADGDVDQTDINLVLAAKNTPANGPNDPRDLNGDGQINLLDARKQALLCTRPRCAVQ